MGCPIPPVLFFLPGADLEELGKKSYVIAGEGGELGRLLWQAQKRACSRDLGLCSPSLYDLSGIDGRVAKEVSLPFPSLPPGNRCCPICGQASWPLVCTFPGKSYLYSSSEMWASCGFSADEASAAVCLGQPQVAVLGLQLGLWYQHSVSSCRSWPIDTSSERPFLTQF